MNNQKIGQYIKQKRKEKKLTQQQLGYLAKILIINYHSLEF